MRITYKLSENDLLEAQRRHGGIWTQLLQVWGVIVLVSGLGWLMFHPKEFLGVIFPIVLGLFFTFGLRWRVRSFFRRDDRFRQDFDAEISDAGVNIACAAGSSQYNWNAFSRYVETKSLFLLYQAPQVFNILPKRAFRTDEEVAFRSLLSDRLGAASVAYGKKISPKTWVFTFVVLVATALLIMALRNIR